MERYKTIHENKVMINPPEDHKPGSSYTENEMGEKPKEWKRVVLPIKPPDVQTIKSITNRPAPVKTPLDWNWTAIIAWSVMLFVAFNILVLLYHLIFNSI